MGRYYTKGDSDVVIWFRNLQEAGIFKDVTFVDIVDGNNEDYCIIKRKCRKEHIFPLSHVREIVIDRKALEGEDDQPKSPEEVLERQHEDPIQTKPIVTRENKKTLYKCRECGDWSAYYRKRTNDYRCFKCYATWSMTEHGTAEVPSD